MKIAHLTYEHGLFLAPMAGVADRAFRLMCRKYGAEGVTTEMISSKALVFGDRKTEKLAHIGDDERPCALQIFGSEPETMARGARLALRFSPESLDINMGCPVHKVVSSGDGSALMRDPQKAEAVLKAVIAEVGKEIPVTVKIRTGFDSGHINAPEIARIAESAGVAAICVHGRTREQMYAPPCDLETIRRVKEAVSVPVIGNGDILSADDAERMLDYTKCDGIMVGRGALGNPYLFYEIRERLAHGTTVRPQSPEEKLEDIRTHMRLLVEDKGEVVAASECRKHLSWYIKGIRGAAALRDEINRCTDVFETLRLVEKVFRGQE